MDSADVVQIITGGCAVRPLPHNSGCASAARRAVGEVAARLLPGRTDDCVEMVSELATNAWLHGLDGRKLDDRYAPASGRSELAIYRRGREGTAELVVTVFDPRPDLEAIPVPAPNALAEAPDKPLAETPPPEILDTLLALLPDAPLEKPPADGSGQPPPHWSGGRGLDAVRELSAGRCGFRRARSRLGTPPVPGKVAWFAVPLPSGSPAVAPPPISLRPDEAVRELESHLLARGVRGVARRDWEDQSVISVPGVNVWCRNEYLTWGYGEGAVGLPYSDFVEAVEQIIGITEDHRDISHPPPSVTGNRRAATIPNLPRFSSAW